jgi:hypothetical protein
MRRWIFSVTLTLSLNASAYTAKSFYPHEQQYLVPDSVTTAQLEVKVMQIRGFDTESLKKLQASLALLEKVVNSEEFKNRIINFKNNKGQRAFASNNGKTNEQIYEIFMDGKEILQPNTPGEMNFWLSLYYRRFSRVVGYTSPSTNVISINWKYFRYYEIHEVAGNLGHEWVHKIGFDHRSASEHDSAPYAIGYIIEELGKKFSTTSRPQTIAQR